jgi:hypothetical protein
MKKGLAALAFDRKVKKYAFCTCDNVVLKDFNYEGELCCVKKKA